MDFSLNLINMMDDGWMDGNTYKIRQDHVRYDLRKFSFSNRVRTLWNRLPDIVENL